MSQLRARLVWSLALLAGGCGPAASLVPRGAEIVAPRADSVALDEPPATDGGPAAVDSLAPLDPVAVRAAVIALRDDPSAQTLDLMRAAGLPIDERSERAVLTAAAEEESTVRTGAPERALSLAREVIRRWPCTEEASRARIAASYACDRASVASEMHPLVTRWQISWDGECPADGERTSGTPPECGDATVHAYDCLVRWEAAGMHAHAAESMAREDRTRDGVREAAARAASIYEGLIADCDAFRSAGVWYALAQARDAAGDSSGAAEAYESVRDAELARADQVPILRADATRRAVEARHRALVAATTVDGHSTLPPLVERAGARPAVAEVPAVVTSFERDVEIAAARLWTSPELVDRGASALLYFAAELSDRYGDWDEARRRYACVAALDPTTATAVAERLRVLASIVEDRGSEPRGPSGE